MSSATYSQANHDYSVDVKPNEFLIKAVMAALVYAVAFINAADFRGDTGEVFTVHWQIYFRLLICAICGMIGIMSIHLVIRPLTTFPGLLISLLLVWIGLTLPMSIDKSYSVAAYVSLGAVLTMLPAAMSILGARVFLLTLGSALLTYLIGSWFVYLALPDIGVFREQVSMTEAVERMGGLGHPNELGQYSAFTVVLFAILGYLRQIRWSLAAPAIALGVATLIVCFSRTSILVSIVGLLVVYRRELFTERTVLAVIALALVLMPLGFLVVGSGELDWMISDAMLKISKSGSTDELTTGTGRTEIWQEAFRQIGNQPLHGYGYVTARFVMEDFSYHCHNIVLNMTLNTGIPGGLILLSMVLYLVWSIITDPRHEIDGLVAIIIAGGLVDGMLMAPVPSAAMLIWFSAVLWRQMDMRLESETDNDSPADDFQEAVPI